MLKGLSLDTSGFVAAVSQLTYEFDDVISRLSPFEAGKRASQIKHEEDHRYETREVVKVAFDRSIPLYLSSVVKQELDIIVNTMAGPAEHQRAEELFSKATILPTPSIDPLATPLGLKLTKSIRHRHLIILASTIQADARILTSDRRFLTACQHQGVDLLGLGLLIIHSPKSLTGL